MNEGYWNCEANFRSSAVEQSGCQLMVVDKITGEVYLSEAAEPSANSKFRSSCHQAQTTFSKVTRVFTKINPADPGQISLPQARDPGLANSNVC